VEHKKFVQGGSIVIVLKGLSKYKLYLMGVEEQCPC
jgi:hypothetical protein